MYPFLLSPHPTLPQSPPHPISHLCLTPPLPSPPHFILSPQLENVYPISTPTLSPHPSPPDPYLPLPLPPSHLPLPNANPFLTPPLPIPIPSQPFPPQPTLFSAHPHPTPLYTIPFQYHVWSRSLW